VTQVTIGLMPFMCYSHPNPLIKSITEFPATTCDSPNAQVMNVGGILSVLVSLAFLGYLAFEMWRAPQKLNSPNGSTYMESILFSIEDFRSDMFFFNIPMKLQELSLGLVTVVYPDNARHQITAFMFIFIISLFLMSMCWPFKPPLLNLTLIALYLLICLGLHVATVDLGDPTPDDVSNASWCTYIFSVVGFSFMIVTILVGIVNRIFQRNQLFAVVQLRPHPDYAAIATMWNGCGALSGQQLAAQLEYWEIGQIANFERILPILSQQVEHTSFGSAVRFASSK
jgi:hypothetical protein